MSIKTATRNENAVALLRRVARRPVAEERCELCSTSIPPIHRHLLEVANRKLICACDPCALRFYSVAGGRFRVIPRDVRYLTNFQMTDAQWDDLAVPINLAFFYQDTPAGKWVAMYPSPAGATESLLPSDNWKKLENLNPALKEMEPDVEALLLNRVGVTKEYFITPIDVCFELIGLIRMHWQGLSGGEKVWHEIDAFFAALREKSCSLDLKAAEVSHA